MGRAQGLRVWHAARQFDREIEAMLRDSPRGGPAKLRAQLSASAGSISDNISEGAGRNTPGEKAAKFRIARGELEEAQNQLGRWYDAGMVAEKRYLNLLSLSICIDRMLTNLIVKNERAATPRSTATRRKSRKKGRTDEPGSRRGSD